MPTIKIKTQVTVEKEVDVDFPIFTRYDNLGDGGHSYVSVTRVDADGTATKISASGKRESDPREMSLSVFKTSDFAGYLEPEPHGDSERCGADDFAAMEKMFRAFVERALGKGSA